MPARWLQVRECRDRAEQLRQAAAEQVVAPSARNGLLKAADGYDRMAADLERKLRDEGVEPLVR